VLCATQGVVAVLSLGMSHYPGIPATSLTGLRDIAVICAAGVLRWAVNGALVYLVLILSRPNAKLSDMFDDVSLHLIEAGAMALGVIAAVLVIDSPWVLVFVAVVVFVMHCGVLLTQLRRETRLDSKTGLFNAAGWHTLAEKALLAARERKGTLGVLMIDIDHFKRINDNHGHLAGDRVLRAVADELRATTRDIDRCGRFGGEEFTIFIPDVATAANLARMAERIRLGIDALTVADIPGRDDVTLTVTVSIGGAVYQSGKPGPQTVDDLVRTADVALYAAKNGDAGNLGRNQVHIAEAPTPPPPAERPASQLP
jgi:diguanylate cyclase (GGDEF)-like protein